MDISAAALPPNQPSISDKDLQHPMFPQYQSYRASMSRLLVQASSFKDWLYQKTVNERNDEIAKHPRMQEFQRWMWANAGGRRKCPAGNSFPDNFNFWLGGGRW